MPTEALKSSVGQNTKKLYECTGSRAPRKNASERYNAYLWDDISHHHPIRGFSTVGSRRRVRHGAGAPRFPPPCRPWRGALTARAECLWGGGSPKNIRLPYNYSKDLTSKSLGYIPLARRGAPSRELLSQRREHDSELNIFQFEGNP